MGVLLDLLLAASVLHAGFQLTVTLVVYPALADVPAAQWSSAHARHSRRIAPVVGLVYVPLALVCAAVLLTQVGLIADGSDGFARVAALVAVAAAGGAALTTALGPARVHGRLGEGHDQVLVRRLVVQDRVRCGFAVLGAAAALVAVLA
ncbi:hypothetical protein KLP28_07020 [Nocardioidaceae bacterium]|nr:hypothetical protein KLP28_07020 [Nocardioidaceae bacterium]